MSPFTRNKTAFIISVNITIIVLSILYFSSYWARKILKRVSLMYLKWELWAFSEWYWAIILEFCNYVVKNFLWNTKCAYYVKLVSVKVTLPPKLSNWIAIFSQIWFTNILTAALMKANFLMIWNMLILFLMIWKMLIYADIRKIINAKKKTINL